MVAETPAGANPLTRGRAEVTWNRSDENKENHGYLHAKICLKNPNRWVVAQFAAAVSSRAY